MTSVILDESLLQIERERQVDTACATVCQLVKDRVTSHTHSVFCDWSNEILQLIEGHISTIKISSVQTNLDSVPPKYYFLVLCRLLKTVDLKTRYLYITRYIEFFRQMGQVDSPSAGMQFLGDLHSHAGTQKISHSSHSREINIPLDFWIRDLQIGEDGRRGQADFEYSVDRIEDRHTRLSASPDLSQSRESS